ncbi:MAG TPA: hypothetical protein VK994_06505, partial [Bacteroidales bacterium]|nr:hypothetical protein [Bacteroidales bacterium]
MKKLIYIVAVVAISLVLSQCVQKTEDNRTLITKKIQYDVPIINVEAGYDWWIKNIAGADREALVENIFKRVLSGEVEAYDYFDEPLSVRQVQTLLVDSVHMTLVRPYEPYAEYDTLIISEITPADISIIRFLEEWKYDEKTLAID